jgi:hypothetical protein
MIRPSLHRALAAAALALLPAMLHAHPVPVPDVPAIIEVEAGHRPYLIGHAIGTQNYVCLPSTQSETGVAWTLFGPQATLFDDRDRQIATHFLSPNPDQGGTPRATWHHSDDSSIVWAVKAQESKDPEYVDPTAIAWFLLRVVGNEDGPTGGDKLSDTTFLQRINTVGGKAPATGCESAGNLGAIQLIPYEADYVFYRALRRP